MVGGPTDAELVAAWQGGDAEAGTRLFDRHVQRLYRFFTSKSQVDPDDLVQRTFLGVVEGAARIRDGKSFRAYLFTIARRLLFAHYQERHKVPVTTLSNKPLAELGPSPTSVARLNERKRVILAALAPAPARHSDRTGAALLGAIRGSGDRPGGRRAAGNDQVPDPSWEAAASGAPRGRSRGTVHVTERDTVEGWLGEAGSHLGADAVQAHQRLRWMLFPEASALGLPARYRVGERLGRGGGGAVYAAYDAKLDRSVAIKVVHDERLRGIRAQSRLSREARAAARVEHPNVIQIFDVGVADVGVYVVMERIAGCDLRQWLAQQERGWREVVDVFVQAGRGLAAAHRSGLIHRDFKPSNVLVGDDRRARVLDFGLARLLSTSSEPGAPPIEDDLDSRADWSVTRKGDVAGTVPYMAPEQHRGLALGPTADVYAYCVALFEAIYGHPPFAARSASSQLAAKEAGPPVPPSSDVPRWVASTIQRGLEPDPAKRWRTMDALLSALTRRRRKHPWLLVGAMAVGLGAMAAWPADAQTTDECGDASVWTDGERDAVASVVGDMAALDHYAAAWVEASRKACDAPAMERCLAERRRSFRALADALGGGNDLAPDEVAKAIGKLEPVQRCEEASEAPRASSPEAEDIRDRIARAYAFSWTGQLPQAMDLARSAIADAGSFNDALLLIAAEFALAQAAVLGGKYVEAREAYARMYFTATRAELAEHRVDAARRAAFVAADREGDVALAEIWVARARDAADEDSPRGIIAELEETEYMLAMRKGEPTRALAHAQVAFDLMQAEYGTADFNVPHAHVNLANALSQLGRHAEALGHYQEAASGFEARFGPMHPQTGVAFFNMGNAQAELGDQKSARTSYERTLTIFAAAMGADSLLVARARMNLAATLQNLGELDLARSEGERGVKDMAAASRAESAELALSHETMGWIYKEQEMFAEAEAEVRESIAMYERLGLSGDPRVGSATLELGHLMRARGDLDGARQVYEEVVALLQDSDIDPSRLANARFALAKVVDDPERGCVLVRSAQANWVATGSFSEEIRDADAWLAEHCN